MTTVAIVGADGAGKTTIANIVQDTCPVPVKYIYMGPNIESSNFKLPTSRLILFLKLQSYKRTAKKKGITDPKFISTHHNAHRKVKRGKIGSTLRLINRVFEGWYRQFIAWIYQLRGYIVLYDRHFLFEAAAVDGKSNQPLTDRIYYWIFTHLFPHPDLVIFLDAEPEILFERKGEGSVEYLQRKRMVFMAQGKKLRNFIRVDAAQPIEKVLDDVNRLLKVFQSSKRSVNDIPQREDGSIG